jgi:hypothetical protein
MEHQHTSSETQATVQPTMNEIIARYFAAEEKRRAMAPVIVKRAVDALRDALAPGQISSILIRYDGYGDSGQVEEITLYRGEEALSEDDDVFDLTIEIPTYQRYTETMEEGTMSGALREVLEYLAMDLIDLQHDGWENNEGGYGEITIRLEEGPDCVYHEHNQRIEAVNQSHWSY